MHVYTVCLYHRLYTKMDGLPLLLPTVQKSNYPRYGSSHLVIGARVCTVEIAVYTMLSSYHLYTRLSQSGAEHSFFSLK